MSQLFIPSSPDQKSPPPSSQYVDSNLKFSASTIQVAHMAEILGAITSIHHQALIIINDSGITLYSEYNHILNAQLTIDASFFSVFEITGGEDTSGSNRELRLGVDVLLISDSFAAAASTASAPRGKYGNGSSTETVVCYMKYEGEGSPLIIEFEDRLMSEQIEFATFFIEIEYPYDTLTLQQKTEDHVLLIDRDLIQFEVILKGDLLSNLLQDLQNLNTQELYMQVSNQAKRGTVTQHNELNFISKGSIGYLKLIFPNGKTMLEKLEIFQQENGKVVPIKSTVLSCFNFLPLAKTLRAVKMSSKCKIMKDSSGVLSLQLLCKKPTSSNYPGTLITFNMLETAVNTNDVGQQVNVDVDDIFDDQLYRYIKQVEPSGSRAEIESRIPDSDENAVVELLADSRQPFSYASFKRPRISHGPEEGTSKSRKPEIQDDELAGDVTTVGGAIEIPLFL